MKGIANYEHISEEVCRELEAIVGSEYITTDPVYTLALVGSGCVREVLWFHGLNQPAACIVMPENTEQVAGIVKVCNRYDIPYVPMINHTIANTSPTFRQDAVEIDLRRMNKMWVDTKNMYAVLEPGVNYFHLQGEILKRDMTTVVPGGGGVVSPVINTFHQGQGHLCYRITTVSLRRTNGVEWVSPEGEIYTMGSLIDGDDNGYWLDGLGPNTIGLLKGSSFWVGGMGIFTKISTKLYPFQPDELIPDGLGANACVLLPPRVRWQNITFPTEEDMLKAIDEIGKAQIGAAVNRVPAYWRSIAKARGNRDFRNTFWESWEGVTPEDVANTHILRVLLIGRTSQEHMDYEVRVLEDIVNECNGTLRRTPATDEGCFMYANTPDMWMPSGGFGLTDAGSESKRCTQVSIREFAKRLAQNPYKSDHFDQKGDLPWFCVWNLGRIYYMEEHGFPDPRKQDPEDPAYDADVDMRFTLMWQLSEGQTINVRCGAQSIFDAHIHSMKVFGPAKQDYPVWIDRFKKEFDPKGVSGCGWPYVIDVALEALPPVITEEAKETVKEMAARPWQGNPEG